MLKMICVTRSRYHSASYHGSKLVLCLGFIRFDIAFGGFRASVANPSANLNNVLFLIVYISYPCGSKVMALKVMYALLLKGSLQLLHEGVRVRGLKHL